MSTLKRTIPNISDPLNLRAQTPGIKEKVVLTGDGAGVLLAGRTDPRYVWVRDSLNSVPYIAKNVGAPFRTNLTVLIQLIGEEWVITDVVHYQGTVTSAQSSFVAAHSNQHLKGGGDTFLLGRDNLADFSVYPTSPLSLSVTVNRGVLHYEGTDYTFARQNVGPLTAPTTINTEKFALIVANPATTTLDVSYSAEFNPNTDTASDYYPVTPTDTYPVARIRLIYNHTEVLPAHITQLQPLHQVPSVGSPQTHTEAFTEATSSPLTITTPPANATIQKVSVLVTTAASAGSPTISIGISGDTGVYMATTENDLLTAATYEVNPYGNTGATPSAIIATIVPDSQTFIGKIFVTYTVAL